MAGRAELRSLYVTGTDTGVGKTLIATALVRALNRTGRRARGLKPLASGAVRTPDGLRNADALALQAEGQPPVAYDLVNPYCFEPAVAPHLAAAEAGIETPLQSLLAWYERASAGCDWTVVEGAGGWRVPLHPDGYTSDLPEALGMPVLLVVGLRLGCLNHARLTYEALRGARVPIAGWIGNRIDAAHGACGGESRHARTAARGRSAGRDPDAFASRPGSRRRGDCTDGPRSADLTAASGSARRARVRLGGLNFAAHVHATAGRPANTGVCQAMTSPKRALAAGVSLLLAGGPALAAWDLNLRVGVTPLSREIYQLHMMVLWVCVAIAAIVFAVMIYSVATFRRSKNSTPATFDHSTTAEVVWTIIPVLILVFMAIPAARVLVAIEDSSGSELTVKVTGYQWKWQYEYVEHGISFFSTLDRTHDTARHVGSGVDPGSLDHYLLEVDRPLVVPQDVKVRVLITAADVIHAWWVPDFGMKKDAIPGFINELWFKAEKPGIYRGQCAELCGRDHGFMPVVVEVKPRAEFDAWLAAQKKASQAADAPDEPANAPTPGGDAASLVAGNAE